MRLIRSGLLAVLLLLVVLPLAAAAQGPRVLVLPFDTHASTDISSARRAVMDALASSLDSEGVEIAGLDAIKELVLEKGAASFTEKDAFEISRKVRADFAVLGSITKLGRTTTVDWRIVDTASKVAVAFYYASSVSEGALREAIGKKAADEREKMVAAIRERPAEKKGTIDRIIVAGNRRVDDEAVLKRIKSMAGAPYSPDDVREDIRAIYGTGFFDDVSASLSDTTSGKTLTFHVVEMPFLKKIKFEGNDELKEEKLKEPITLKENTVLDRVTLGQSAERIKQLYNEEGFYLAKVEPVIESDGLEATVIFKIDEGPEVKVKRITFIGNKAFGDRQLKKLMNTKEKGLFSFVTESGKFNEFLYQNDLAIVMSHYFDNGYIRADIIEDRVLLSQDKKWFYITIAVAEGEQFRVGKIDVSGDLLVDREELIDKIKLTTGDVFNRSRLSKGIEAIAEIYGDKGYAYADIKPVTAIDEKTNTIDVTIDIRKNDLVYIERIDITGNIRTRDKVIRREMELGEGDLFSSSGLKRSRNNLRRLGFFDSVNILQSQGTSPARMKLDLDIKERPTGQISLGLGYSSVDKVIGTASISQSNFMGTGIKLDLSGTVSASSSTFVFGITEPWLFDKPISAGIDLYNTSKEYPDFDIAKKGFDLRFGFPITKRYTRGFMTYKLEDVNITNVQPTASTFIKDQAGESTESSIKTALRRDTRNDAFFPSEGSVLNLSVEFAGGLLGGTNQFIKYEGDAVKFFALPWETTFSVHGSVGFVQGYGGEDVPIFERYYLGGINSVRGFETRTVGPKDPATGDVIGGTSMITANVEFLFPLVSQQNIKGLLFFDAGNAYDGPIDLRDLRTSAGTGIRWFSPFGPLRLELGFNLDRREGEKASQWDFTIGTIF
ncbi:MAG: outer membrane protein assembly factor BamA [Thermodesulfobacteriota bacterium]